MSRGGGSAPPQRVCFFGTYARDHAVTQLLVQACDAAGIEVVECHRSLWEKTRHKTARYFGLRSLLRLLREYAAHARALARMRRQIAPVPVYLVGFNGQLDCMLLRLLQWRRPTPVVLAPLVTLTETLIDDRRVFGARSPQALAVRLLDRLSLHLATQVVIDTEAHRQYLIENFGMSAERVSVWYLGADQRVFAPAPELPSGGALRVLFYGTFLPLHGVDTVLQAAALLRDDCRVEFVLVGDGPGHAASVTYARDAQLRRVHFQAWLPYEEIGRLTVSADLCLGIFGANAKAQMVIPNKVYQAAATGRVVVTADTPAVREVFAHGETAWLCPAANPHALADAIRRLCDDPSLRRRIGRQAGTLMADRFAPVAQGQRLAGILAAAVRAA
jgi:glycosyltransferase involved in cell wall biosynthesis